MKIKVLYAFENDKKYLIEVKDLTKADDAPKELVYSWLVVSKEDKSISRLAFQSMSKATHEGKEFEVRNFEEAELKFDDKFAQFVYEDTLNLMSVTAQEELDSYLINNLEVFITGA